MGIDVSVSAEETLDPDDWPALRALGQQMVADMLTYLETVRERPAWQPIPDSVKTYLKQPAPRQPQGVEQAYQEFLEQILPHPMGNIHPRFWAWVNGTGTPLGVLAEMLAATMNPNLAGGEHLAPYVEAQVIDWCKEMLGYPAQASGILTSGASVASLVGLTVARNSQAEINLRYQGLQVLPRRMTLYASQETHSAIQRAVELLGLGSEALRQIPVDADFRLDLPALEQTIEQDHKAGYQPICVIGNAGTVNTGAIDDLNGVADICQREGLWFHIDGALGALAALSPALRPLVAGIERADSIAFDLHKWMYLPYEVGCALVRHAEAHRQAFSMSPEYLTHGGERGLTGGEHWFSNYGVQTTRGFRALKVWLLLKAYGLEKFGRLIRQNVEQARYLAGLVEAAPELERLAPVSLNIVCFRYCQENLTEAALAELNREILIRLHESGVAAPSSTILNGQYALRVAITNHRSRREDFELLAREVVRLGQALTKEY